MFDLSNLGDLAKNGADLVKGASAIASALKNTNNEAQAQAAPESEAESMYSAQLEKLIAMAIEDGEISEEDMAMLRRRAEKEGVDLDEFEFVVRKRLKKTVAADPCKGMTPVEKLRKMLADCEPQSSSSKSLKSLGMVVDMIPGLQGVGGFLAGGEHKAEEVECKKKAVVISGFPLPENGEDFAQIVNLLIAEFETGISGCRESGSSRTENDVKLEKLMIRNNTFLSALDSKLRLASGMNQCAAELRSRISLVLDPPVRKKLFGLF